MATIGATAVKDNNIRIGDVISLKFPKRHAYLSAEGILVEDVFLNPSSYGFEEHLFQIYVQRQYSATNELGDFLHEYPDIERGKLPMDAATSSHYEALVRGKENESNLNRSVMQSKTGNVVYFGDTIQLFHVKSKKYVTALDDLARDERENMKVGLSNDGSVFSWLKVMPRYKINREGEPVINGTEVLLKFSERNNEFLHCADRPPPRGKFTEVNSSLESPTGWKLGVFHKASDLANQTLLLTGQLVYLRDPESLSMLSPLPLPISLQTPKVHLQSPNNLMSPTDHVLESPWNASSKVTTSFRSGPKSVSSGQVSRSDDVPGSSPVADDEEDADDVSISSFQEFVQEFGGIVLKPGNEDQIDFDAIWMLESKSLMKGGPIYHKADRVLLRHFNTGKYLGLEQKADGSDNFTLCLDNEPHEKRSHFMISELHSAQDTLRAGKAIQIVHAYYGILLQRGDYQDSQKAYACLSTRSKSKAVSMILNRYVQKDNVKSNLSVASQEETLDVSFGRAVMHHLTKFVKQIVLPSSINSDATTIWPKIDPADLSLFPLLMTRATIFVQGYPIRLKLTGADGGNTVIKASKHTISRRQDMFRELGLIEAIMVIVQKLQPISDILNSGASSSGGTFNNNNSNSKMSAKGTFVEVGKNALSECLSLLYELIRGNIANQLYIADHLLVILAHVSTDKMAAKVAQELLSDNRELQETKIGRKEITIFSQKMREVHMNAMYLQLLKTCCSCLRQSIPKNQDLVNHILFHTYQDVLISVRLDRSMQTPVDWGVNTLAYELYLEPAKRSPGLLCAELLTSGIASIKLTWSISSPRFAIEKIYNKTEIFLSELDVKEKIASSSASSQQQLTVAPSKGSVSVPRAAASSSSSPVAELETVKVAIHDFFVSQLQLAGEMCLDRNYAIIEELEKRFSYELLVSILKVGMSEAVRAEAAYLLLYLHVDRDPQTAVPLPRLTRTLNEVSQPKFSELLWLSEPQNAKFALLQSIISSHIDSIREKPFPLHSLNLFGLLHALVRFHFYGKVNLMDHVVKSLISCLKRGDFDLEAQDSNEHSNYFASSVMKLSITAKSASSKRLKSSKQLLSKSPSGLSSEDLSQQEADVDNRKSKASSIFGRLFPSSGSKNGGDSGAGRSSKDAAEQWLSVMESLTYHLYMSAFIVCACAASLYLVIVGRYDLITFAYEGIVFGILLIELLLRFTLWTFVKRYDDNVPYGSSWSVVMVAFFYDIFHLIDVITLALYGMIFSSHPELFEFAKFAQLSRFARLFRLFEALKNADAEREKAADTAVSAYVLPARFVNTNEYTLDVLQEIVNTMKTVQQNMLDRQLSIFLKLFHKQWVSQSQQQGQSQLFKQVKEPRVIFEAILETSSDLEVSNDAYDDIYMDLIMYSRPSLVQCVLDLLLLHHSSQRCLLDSISSLQVITSERDEKNFEILQTRVLKLQRYADTHDIWGALQTEEHRQINAETYAFLEQLAQQCQKLRDTLQFDEKYEPITFIQNILRNLGCFEACMKLARLVIALDKEDAYKEAHVNTTNLALAANRLIYWLILGNPTNQLVAYGEFPFFVKTIDSKIESHRVIHAIFHDNLELMEKVPKKFIKDFVEMICSQGKFPQYLSLLSSIISVGEKNVIGNQYEVIKLISAPENQKKLLLFFVPTNHPDYAKKLRLMSGYLHVQDVQISDLPSDLAYHLEFLGLLSSCTLGTSGMTSIEAKVQGMYGFVDVIEAMLDPQCLLLAKIRYGKFLYNAMLDVETPLPALKDSAVVWKVLLAAQDIFAFARDELRQIEKNGWNAPSSHRQKVEYMLVNAMFVESYFASYFDYSIFKPEVGQIALGVERVTLKEGQANELMKSLYQKILALYEMLSPLLAREHHELLYSALVALNNASRDKFVQTVENLHAEYFNSADEYNAADEDKMGKAYESFVNALNKDESVKANIDAQIQVFIAKIERLPSRFSGVKADVFFEPFLEKLVAHIRGSLQIIIHGDETIKFISPAATKTSTWLLKIFRTMIENRWGMSIYERDDDGGEEQDDAVAELMIVYNSSGMTELCLDLIAKGIDITLQSEALKLLVGMLFKEGGALAIQRSVHNHLSRQGSDIFFRTVRQILHNLMSWHEWNKVVILEPDEEPELPDEIIIVRCLQLFCEGHFKPNQDILREQPQNNLSVNLLDDFVLYIQKLDRYRCRTSTTAGLAVAATILEVIQGPCEKNQDHFALNTELIETINRKLRQASENDCDEGDELEFKKTTLDILQALLEGQGRKIQIYERMLSVIHVDVLLLLCRAGTSNATDSSKDGDKSDDKDEGKDAAEEDDHADEIAELRTESLVLLQMLLDFRPSLREELDLGADFTQQVKDSIACIEVVWRGELQRRFFSVPDICSLLAKSTKDNFIMNVKRSSPEDKLFGLLEGAKEMYREVLHQRKLQEYRLDNIFSRTNQAMASWFNFYVAVVINLLFLIFYVTEKVDCSSDSEEGIHEYEELEYKPPDENEGVFCSNVKFSNPHIDLIVLVLTIVLISSSAYTLLSNLVVRAPVSFQACREKGYTVMNSALYTMSEPSFLRHLIYLVFPVAGLFYYPALSVSMLDFISMSPTTQAVLNAVYDPRQQILMTTVLILIILYIFAMFQFFFFVEPGDNFSDDYNASSLANIYKFLIRLGFPYSSPANQMEQTISSYRVFNDILFFLACIIMSNVLKGITIDSFVALRAKLEKRILDTTERCFICGIEKNTFNRTLDRDAFRQHTQDDQNLWNYVYFIIFIWEQDKDDDDGFEWFTRRCIDDNDLTWFPMNKAIRLAEYQEKGDVRSLKYRFRQDMLRDEAFMGARMKDFKEQVTRTIGRVEKALEYEHEGEGNKRLRSRGVRNNNNMNNNNNNNGNNNGNNGNNGLMFSFPPTPNNITSGSATATGNARGSTSQLTSRRATTANAAGGGANSSGTSSPATGGGKLFFADDVSVHSIDSANNNNNTTNYNTNSNQTVLKSAMVNASAASNLAGNNASYTVANSALDMEHLSQLHLRVVSITGLLIVPEYVQYIQVKVTSDFESAVLKPIADMEAVSHLPNNDEILQQEQHYANASMANVSSSLRTAKTSFRVDPTLITPGKPSLQTATSAATAAGMALHRPGNANNNSPSKKDERVTQVKLQFDLFAHRPLLVHQGPLPTYDLSRVMIKVQVLFNASGDENSRGVYLAGGRIPLILLLNKVMEGGILDLVMYQRSVQLNVATAQNSTTNPSSPMPHNMPLSTQFSFSDQSVEDVVSPYEDSMKSGGWMSKSSSVGALAVDEDIFPPVPGSAAGANNRGGLGLMVDSDVEFATTIGSARYLLPPQLQTGNSFRNASAYHVTGNTAGVVAVPSTPSQVERVTLLENTACTISVSAVASRRLLQDWAMLK